MIEVANIGHAFGDNRVLRGVSFEARPGSITGVVGTNGAGKSTLMRAIAGDLLADRLDVPLVEDVPIDELDGGDRFLL